MSILISEGLISLSAAAKLLPGRRRGKKPHVSCLYRWTTAGCKGVILEAVQVGGTRCTSREALDRFFARLSRVSHARRRTVAGRERAVKAAERELESQ